MAERFVEGYQIDTLRLSKIRRVRKSTKSIFSKD